MQKPLDDAVGTLDGGEATGTERIELDAATSDWRIEIQDLAGVRRIRAGTSPMVLGSGARADVRIEDATVSARHCEVFACRDGVCIRDLDSTNGTYIGGARVKEAWGKDGTTVVVGQSTLSISVSVAEADVDEATPLPGIVGASAPMRRIAAQVRRLAKLSAPVLVTGETGVGKELVARALHTEGPRVDRAFVPMNVAALPRELVESELFGHERGAFSGAVHQRTGAFAEADGGTLFLDEIGELPLDAQPKLLRALDGYEVRRVGASGGGRRANARVVAATHVALAEGVFQGTFRRDLFHRLEVFVVEIPPLRARPSDVLPIARALLRQLEREVGPRELTPSAIAHLVEHDWPGNVRELRNVLVRAADMAGDARYLDAHAMERALRRPRRVSSEVGLELAETTLARFDGNVSAAARSLGLPRTTFRKILTSRGPCKTSRSSYVDALRGGAQGDSMPSRKKA